MRLLVQCLIFVAVLIPPLVSRGGSPFGPIFEKIKDKERVDHYNKVALESVRSTHLGKWKESDLKVISTTESICGSEYVAKVMVSITDKKTKKRDMVAIIMTYEGEKPIVVDDRDLPSGLFELTEEKGTIERYGKIVLNHLIQKTGLKYEKPSFLVLEIPYADKDKEGKLYAVAVFSLDENQKKVPRALSLVLYDGTFFQFGDFRNVTEQPKNKCLRDIK
ncbi:uncharacterized protein LOC141857434 [Brevipalpus obovatus]|uniref:uncharacterized protein LOC141857434 n=1 Tax=Brevipalpus obovatus TaxID=246614 RepID=UPI003D9ED5AC